VCVCEREREGGEREMVFFLPHLARYQNISLKHIHTSIHPHIHIYIYTYVYIHYSLFLPFKEIQNLINGTQFYSCRGCKVRAVAYRDTILNHDRLQVNMYVALLMCLPDVKHKWTSFWARYKAKVSET